MPGSEPQAAPAKSGGRLSPRNWRVPTRLNAILLIPVVVGLVMGGFQVKGSIDTWQEAQDAENTAKLVRAALTYSNALLVERDVTAAPLLQGKGENDPTVVAARKATDKASDDFDTAAQSMPDRANLVRRLKGFRDVEPQLQTLRADAYTAKMTGVRTEEGYVNVEHKLLEFSNELGLGTGNITSYGRTVYALALGQGALSLQRSIGMHLLIKPGTSQTSLSQQRVALTSYAYLENIATQEYQSGGTEQDIAKLAAAQKQIQADAATMIQEQKAKNPDYVAPPTDPVQFLTAIASIQSTDASERAALAEQGVTAENWWAMTTLKFDAYRKMESSLSDTAVTEASGIASDAQRDAYITGAIVVVALLLAFILASAVARQMSRSMRQLRNAAFGIAEQRLPMLVDQLSRTDPGRVDTRVAPIPINTTDEIGEVARAFDQVHREAVRLAAEQALLRGNINAIFTNLSRRNQSLIEGQLTLITDLENNEADPDQLENLFRLDHLATRMRRNGENLLVLAGEEPGRRWDQPVPLVDVLRAASSEVEQYERIELSGVPEAEIHGRAVTDLVHLLAELLENATTFSSPQTKVRVTATRLPDGRVMIEIHDKGIGLTAEDFADINHKLANPPTVDAAISQRMGLFVVGRLSDRHGIRVQLRPSGEQAGTTSLVMLPDAITHGGGGEHQPEQDQFTVSQIIPEQQFGKPGGESFGQPQQQPMRTAAELGFDDTRYEVPDDIRDLDPVGRSLMREERRAALEAPQAPQNDASFGGPQQTQETPLYGDSFTDSPQVTQQTPQLPYGSPQNGFDGAPTGFVEQPQAPQSPYGAQSPYEGAQQASYEEPYFAPQAPANGGGGYPEPGAQERGAGASNGYPGFEEPSYQDDWPQQGDYRNGYPDQYAPEAESAQVADEAQHVGFDRPGPAPSAAHSLTDAGLPRRGGGASGAGAGDAGANGVGATAGTGVNGVAQSAQQQETPAPQAASDDGSWRSANDERWQQASQLRKPKAGGVTSSGLPRRVPKANLVEGAAETTQQGGPQISRAPEDIRGRLSNLRRGVQRGRTAGSETNGQGFGPDSTYNQER